MKGFWLAIVACTCALGCAGKPKREMKQPTAEEFAIPPANQYLTQRDDLPREDQLVPRISGPSLNTSAPALPSAGSPGAVPGTAPGSVGSTSAIKH
jgi:hypothetical protein